VAKEILCTLEKEEKQLSQRIGVKGDMQKLKSFSLGN